MRRLRATVLLTALLSAGVLGACSVDGEAAAQHDLSDRSVTAQDFPGGSATRVSSADARFALNDLVGASQQLVAPSGCAPKRLDPGGAVVYFAVPGGGATSFTSAVVNVGDDLGAVRAQIAQCPRITLGTAPAVSIVESTLTAAPAVTPAVPTLAFSRVSSTGSPIRPTVTATRTLVAQRGAVRVYVQGRTSAGRELDHQSRDRQDRLFAAAVKAAFH